MDDQTPQAPPPPPPGWHDDPQDPTSLRYWDGTQWTDQRAPKPGAPPQGQTLDLKDWPGARIAVAIGAVAVLIGSFGPWVTASALFVSITRNGVDGDGKFTAVGAAGIVVLVVTKKYLGALIVSAVTGAIVLWDLYDTNNRVSDMNTELDSAGMASVGWGLWLAAGGAVVAFVGAVTLWQDQRKVNKSEGQVSQDATTIETPPESTPPSGPAPEVG